MGMGGQHHVPAALPPVARPGTHFIGGWLGSRAGLDGCGQARPTGIRSPDRPARSQSLYRLRITPTYQWIQKPVPVREAMFWSPV
jgi:hypothetical protein